jgi:hypothetical protein
VRKVIDGFEAHKAIWEDVFEVVEINQVKAKKWGRHTMSLRE